ncbi:hypothetical protein CK203_117544 [Vitis vinifera]|uniref:Uncharacterized protein n=1 Tax=Vitis vinifera TaxID=29760 RepID=A0A438CP34_VITVI|nr:hypothetical protein CK203_117544 [Vitis vinifera]
MFEAIEYLASSKKLEDGFGMDNVAVVNGRGKMTSNPRLRRVLWNPWQSNGRLRNMNNRSFEVLCHKQIRNARRGSKEKSCQEAFLMTVIQSNFGDFSSEDERLGSLSLGVKKAG